MMTHRSKQITTLIATVTALFCLYGFVSVALAQDMVIEKTVIPTTPVQPGDTLTYTITFTNPDVAIATNVFITDTLPLTLTNIISSYSGIPTITPTGGKLSWEISDLAQNQGGVITVIGQVSSSLIANTSFTNTVVITASNDPIANNNSDTATTTVQLQADLTIGKQADPDPAAANRPLTYTVFITNTGPDLAPDIIVTDTLPTELTFSSVTPSQGTCPITGQTIVCNLGVISLALVQSRFDTDNEGWAIKIIHDTNGNNQGSNTMVYDPANGNPDGHVRSENRADGHTSYFVAPSKYLGNQIRAYRGAILFDFRETNGSSGFDKPTPEITLIGGGLILDYDIGGTANHPTGVWQTYQIPLAVSSNWTRRDSSRPADASNPVATAADFQTVLANLTEFRVRAEYRGGNDRGYLDNVILKPGPATLSIVTIPTNTTGVTVTNIATATTSAIDSTPNVATEKTRINARSDLQISKTSVVASALAGDILTYTITLTNNGPDDVTNLVITDTLPDELSFSSYNVTPTGLVCDGNKTIVCTQPFLANGDTVILNLSAIISPATTLTQLTNTVVVTNQVPDNILSNNTATATTMINRSANLSVSKASSPDPVVAGKLLTYTITITNSGPSDGGNVIITDTLPASVTLTSSYSASQGTCNTATATCNLGTMSRILVQSTFDTNDEGWQVINNATNPDAPDYATTGGNPSGYISDVDDQTGSNFFYNAPAKFLNNQSKAYGGILEFDLFYMSNGGSFFNTNELVLVGSGVTLEYDLPSPTSAGIWQTISIPLRETTAGWNNTTTSQPPTTSEMLQVLSNLTALQIRGDYFNGVNDVSRLDNVTLTAGPIRVVFTATVGSTITPNTFITNTVEVSSATPDLDTKNNVATETTLVIGEVDLSLSKVESADPINAGDILTYTLTISNAGPSAAQDVVVTDTLPMSVTVTYSGTSLGNGCDAPVGGVISCSLSVVDTVTNSGSAVITLAMLLDTDILSGTILSNTAGLTVTSSQTELNLTNNSLTTPVTTTVSSEANLIIRKLDDPDPVTTNRPLTYTIVITNAGPSDALNVVMTDTLIGASTVLSSATFSGTPCTTLGPPTVCNLGTLTSSSRATVTILLRPTAEGVITNVVTATTTTFDSTTPNTARITTTVYGEVALTLTKSVDDTSPALGQRLTYTMVLSNGGTTNATGVVLSDTLPNGLIFVPNSIAVQPNQTGLTLSAPPQAQLVSGLAITHGERVTVTFGVTVGATLNNGDNVINTAAITSVQPSGAIPVTDSVSFTIDNQVDLEISKTVMPPVSTLPGRRITYTLRFTNSGAGLATGVLITDLVPISLTTASLGFTFGGDVVVTNTGVTPRFVFDISDMAAGEVGLITITGQLSSPLAAGRFTNTAIITTTTVDSDMNNNMVKVGLTVLPEIVINEVDADTPGTDTAEFIELYDGGVGNTPLDGLVLVTYDGNDNKTYGVAVDLDGLSTDANGYHVLGNSAVANVDTTFANNRVQNGPDAIALYIADYTDFPDNTLMTTDNLLDAFVYNNSGVTASGLAPLLNGGQLQINENGNGDKDNQSNQRCPDGTGGLRNTSTYTQALPSPGFANNCSKLSMSKTAMPLNIGVSEEITYTIIMTNAGVGNAETVRLTDTLPTQVDFVRWITQSGAAVAADEVTWSGSLTAGENLTVSFVVKHVGAAGDLITNTAEISHASLATQTTSQAFVAVDMGLVINEILANVPADANRDGVTSDTNDEFVEIVNNTGNSIDISGWRLNDGDESKHTFPMGSIIPSGCAIVVFGKGTPTGIFGGSTVQTSTNQSLGLTDIGDTVSLVNGNFIMADYTYGAEANNAQSITRNPDITGSDPLVQHQAVAGSPFLFSPGTQLDGATFSGCDAPARLSLTKAVTPTMDVPVGGLVTYTLVLSNGGTGNAVGSLLTDTLPVSTTFSRWLTQSGATNSGNLITWNGMVTYQQAITFSFVAQHTGGNDDVVTNTAVISYAGKLTESNLATFIVEPIPPVITISKRVNPITSAAYQGEITYTLFLTNGTTTNATGLRLTDTLPISTTFARWLNQPSGATNSATQITWNGSLTASESLAFSFVVTHTGNGYGEVIKNSAEFEFTGVVTPSNEAVFTITRQPLAVDDSYTTAEGSPLTIAASGVLTNDSDPDGDSLTVAIAVSPTHAATFSFNPNGGFTYTSADNFAGQDVFTYTVSDGRGGLATATVTINITPTNDAPLIGRNFVLYDGRKGLIPATSLPSLTSGLIYTGAVLQAQVGNNVVVNTTANNNFYAGYGGNPALYPTPLNHNNGYTLKFSAQVNAETHANNNRAGFSVIAVSANTTKAIELGFWTNRIFAQEGGSGPTLFTQAEHAVFDTTSALVDYELTVLGDSYILTANGADVLSGTMRDYTAFTPSASLPVDPYETANFIFLGDDTTSAQGQFSIGYVSVIVPESSPANPLPNYTTVANTNLSIDSVGAIDFDAAGNNVVLTMTVNNGVLNVSNTGDLAGISGNGSDTLIMTGTLRAINNALGVTQTLRYRSNPGFMGTDTVTVRLNDRGFTGGGVLTDTASFNINVLGPVLTMTKVVDDAAPIPGQRITYTLVLSNGGNYTATSGLLSDTLPTGLTFAAAQIEPSGAGTVGSPTNLATNLVISPNRLITVTAQFTVAASLPHGTVITNRAALSSAEVITPVMATALLTVTNEVDLQVSKQVITSSNPVKPGDTVTYTISFSNVGKGLAQGIVITDVVPSLLTSVSIQTDTTLAMTRTGATTAVWQVADMLNDTSGVITISGVISPLLSTATRFTNTVRLTSTTVQSETSNDMAEAGLMVQIPALTITKTIDDDTPSPGQTVTYTIVLSNGGGAPITGATLSDTLPISLSFVSGSVNIEPNGAGTVGASPNWATGLTVGVKSMVTVTLQTSLTNQAVDGERLINTASVSATALPTAITASVVATVSNQADLIISKTVTPSGPVKPGERITYTLSFTNNGPGVAQSVRISDTLPTGLSGLSYQPSGVSVTATGSISYAWQVADLLVNQAGSIQVSGQISTAISSDRRLTNTVEISTVTPDNGNSVYTATVGLDVGVPTLTMSKQSAFTGATLLPGQTITYSIIVTNSGSITVTSGTVSDTIPANSSYVSGSIAGGSSRSDATAPNLSWTVSNVAPMTAQTLTFRVTVDNGAVSGTQIINQATLTSSEIITMLADMVTDTVVLPVADIALNKTRLGSGDVLAGGLITYTLRITNSGPNAVNRVLITDTFMGGVTNAAPTASSGSCSGSGPIVCQVDNFMGSETITVVLTTNANFSGTVTNTAEITFAAGAFATDNNPGDTRDSVITTVRFPQADLQISKARVGSGDVIAGQPITYTLRITNVGPDVVSQVVVTDTVNGMGAALSGNLIPSIGSCVGAVCTFANFTGTATITAVVNTSGSYSGTVTNTAVISFGNGVMATDISSGNESDRVVTAVRFPQADLQISKVRVGSGDVLPGQSVTFTLRITNVGPDVPSQIVVTDRFTQTTAGLISSVSSQRSDGGSCTTGASPLTCQFNNLTNTQTITFVFNSSSSLSGLVSNTAEITFASGVVAADTNLANNGPTSVVTALIAGTDLSVSKSVNDSTPFENQQIVYTIQVNNNGPDAATGVVISDALPSGVTHGSNNGGGAYNVGSGSWTVPGTLANGGSATLVITATVDAGTKGNTITNTATLNTSSPTDLNSSNNLANAPITVEIPTVSFIAPASINETGGSRSVQVQLNMTDTANITVDYAVSGGSASNGTDYGLTAGTLTFPSSGPLVQTFTVFITDDAIFEGNETINFQLSNVSGNAQIGTANTTLTIVDNESPPNAAPVGNADVYNTTAGMTLTVAAAGVLVNDTDANGDSLTAQLVVNVTHGTLTLSANGSFVYRPNAGFAGTDSFRYRANDGKTNSGLTTVTINVTNESPTANDDSYTLVQDTVLTVTAAGVLANDSDSDGHPLTATLSSGPSNGSLTVGSNGAFTYTPTSGFIGTDSFTYTVSDGYGGVATATVKLVVSLDPPQVGFTQATQSVVEDAGTIQLAVVLSKVSAITVTVDYVINPDTAVANDDYLAMNGSLTFPPGTLTQTIPLTIVDDLINEASEQLTVRLQNGVNGVVQPTNNPMTVVITDDDPLPTVLFDVPTYQVDEDAGNIVLTVSLNAPSGQPITVTVTTTDGTAIAPADYTAVSSTLTFSPGVTQVTVVIPILNDGLSEGEESFTVGLSDAGGATVGAPSSATVTIIDTSRPTVQFATAGYSINENGGQATIMVTLNQTSSLAVTVAYASADGTATAGNDYTAVSGVLTFPAGSLMQMFSVPITDDTLTEPNETVNLQLSNPTHALSGTLMAAVLTIRDNEVVTLTNLVATNDSPTSLGQPTQFTATVTPASNVTYSWLFGDGSTGSGPNPTHVYPTAGVYMAVVTASNSINLLTATTVVTVNSEDIEITGLTIISEETILTFEGTFFTATVTSGTNINYVWNLGDGTIISNGAIIGHTYTTVATYTVVVTASNSVSRIVETTTVTVYDFVKYLDRADIGVIKTVSSSPAVINTLLTYTLIVSNSGPNTARDVILTDTLPTNVQIVTLPSNCQNQGNIVCMLGDIANKQTITLTLGVSPTVVGTLVNQVAASIDQMDPDLLNNTFELPLAVGHAKVTLEPSMSSTVVYSKPINLTATQITVPAGVVTEPLVLLLTELDAVQNLPDGVESAGLAFTVDLYQNGQVVVGRTLTDPVTMTLSYPADVPPDQLQLLYWNGSQWVDAVTTCQPPASYVFDPSQKQVSLPVCQLPGRFAWGQQSEPKPPVAPVYLPIILHGGDNRPSTSTPVTPDPTAVTTPVASPTSTTPNQPDLSVRVSLSPDKQAFSADEAVIISVVVTNQGQQTVTKSFWVDLFINPKTPPTDGRRIWNENCSLTPCYGMAWQVTADLAPGESVTLLSTNDSFSPPHTTWPGKFAAGTTSVYVYVDTWTPSRGPDGAILESDESNNRAEITGLSVTGSPRADQSSAVMPQFPSRWLAEE